MRAYQSKISIVVLISLIVLSTSPSVAAQNVGQGTATLDDLFVGVATRVPGFGGMFIDRDILKVYLVNPAERVAAEAAIAAVFGREVIPAGGIQTLQGQYSFLQLKGWYERMGVLFDIPGVILTDIGEGANRLMVGVDGSATLASVAQALDRLGIPRAAVNIVDTKPIVFVATLQDRIRPLEGGLQIAFVVFPFLVICTLGFNGIRSGVEGGGFVVNSHCTQTQGGVDNTNYYQPDPFAAGNFVGTETADPLYTKAKCPAGMKGKVCRWSDSAYAQRDSAVTADLGFIERPASVNSGSLTISGTFRITSENASVIGQTLNKVGRTTGWTQGIVTATCVNVGVQGTKIVQRCQDMVSAGVGPGDSGSPVFSITNSPSQNDVQLRGILWGGNQDGTTFVYSPIANIQRTDELGPITNCAPTFSC